MSNTPKLYSVRVVVALDIPVVADSVEDARSLALGAYQDEVAAVEPWIEPEECDALPVDFEGCLAYWDPKYAGDPRTQLTVDNWFKDSNE